jgi:cytoskeletal protein RodZ
MEAFEKQFRDAFEDYRIPVGEAAWLKVQAKQKRRIGWYLPLARIAAAIALLVFSWFVYRAVQPAQQAPSAHQLSPLAHVEADRPLNDQEVYAVQDKKGIDPAAPAVDHQMDTHISQVALPAKTTAPAPAASIHPIPKLRELPQPVDQPWSDHIATVPEMPLRLAPSLIPVLLPADVRSDLMPSMPSIPTMEMASIIDVKTSMIKPLVAEDLTGPERLVAVLDRYKPRFVNDLVSLASRTTEIELNW